LPHDLIDKKLQQLCFNIQLLLLLLQWLYVLLQWLHLRLLQWLRLLLLLSVRPQVQRTFTCNESCS
jgi:hypothetical protein